MDINATLRTDLRAEELYPVLIDLATYPEWIGIVGRAVAEDDARQLVRARRSGADMVSRNKRGHVRIGDQRGAHGGLVGETRFDHAPPPIRRMALPMARVMRRVTRGFARRKAGSMKGCASAFAVPNSTIWP